MENITDFEQLDAFILKESIETSPTSHSKNCTSTDDLIQLLSQQHGVSAKSSFIAAYKTFLASNPPDTHLHALLDKLSLTQSSKSFPFKDCLEDTDFYCGDAFLLLLGRIASSTPSTPNLTLYFTTLLSFFQNWEQVQLHDSTLFLLASTLLKRVTAASLSDTLLQPCASTVHCIVSHPCWTSWDALDSLLQDPSFSIDIPSVARFLDCTEALPSLSPTYQHHLIASVFLPLLEHPASCKPLKSALPHLSNTLRSLIQCVSPSVESSYYALWIDCCLTELQSSQHHDDTTLAILQFVLQRCAARHLSYLVLNHSYKLLLLCAEQLIASHITHFVSPLTAYTLQSLLTPTLNPRLQSQLLSILALLLPQLTSQEKEEANKTVCAVLSTLVKTDIEKKSEVRHDEWFRLLASSQPSLSVLISFLLAPLYTYLDSLLSIPEIGTIVVSALEQEADASTLFAHSSLGNAILCAILRRCPPALAKNYVNRIQSELAHPSCSVQRRTQLLFTLLGVCRFFPVKELPCFTSWDSTQLTLLSQALLETHNESMIKNQLDAWLLSPTPLCLDGLLPPQLQVVAALPFSFVQEAIITHSISLHSNDDLLALLRLLRVVNWMSFGQNQKRAASREEDGFMEESNATRVEMMLNVIVTVFVHG